MYFGFPSSREAQTKTNLAVALRTMCEQTLPFLASRFLLIDVEESFAVLPTLAPQGLSPHVVYLNVLRPLLRLHFTHSTSPSSNFQL